MNRQRLNVSTNNRFVFHRIKKSEIIINYSFFMLNWCPRNVGATKCFYGCGGALTIWMTTVILTWLQETWDLKFNRTHAHILHKTGLFVIVVIIVYMHVLNGSWLTTATLFFLALLTQNVSPILRWSIFSRALEMSLIIRAIGPYNNWEWSS